MHRFLSFLLGSTLLACSVIAQSEPAADVADQVISPQSALQVCLLEAELGSGAEKECIGMIIDHCPDNSGTTADMLDCIASEMAFWDDRLNSVYGELIAAYEALDKDMDDGRTVAALIRSTQRQWMTWRDAKCGFEYEKYRGGTMGRLAGAFCQMEETANRTFELQDLLAEAPI